MATALKPAVKKAPRTPEEKVKAFNKLANARVNKALKALKQLKHLTNTNTYSYTPEQVKRIDTVLTAAVKEIAVAFADPKAAKSEGFTL